MLPIISTHKKLLLLLIIILIFISVWIFVKYRPTQKELPPAAIFTSTSQSSTVLTSTTTASTTITQTIKTYKNTEWGFEFQYPKDWKIIENPYRSPVSRFNLIIAPETEQYLPDPILINIVVPVFVDNSFHDLKGIDVIVADIFGKKYEYQEKSLPEISIILPFGQYKIILGAEKKYENIFNQFIESFKFLK